MERLNWSSIVRSIHGSRSGKALFFKPVCVIAALDLAAEDRIVPDDIDAEGILNRFADYITPFFRDRGNDGYQPLWHLSNNQLWTFFKDGRALTSKEFSDGKPGTKKRLFERFDRLAIHEGVGRLWASPEERLVLRDQMLLMLQESGGDSRQLVPPLFNPQHLLDREQWPSQEVLNAHFAPMRQASLFDDEAPNSFSDHDEEPDERSTSTATLSRTQLPPAPNTIENVPSPIDYAWSSNRIVVEPNLASVPLFPFASSKIDHTSRLEACGVQASDLLRDLDKRRWQLREDYKFQIERYLERLPEQSGSGNILLADAATRILRDMFAAERAILPAPFAAGLKALLQQHIALRPFYPELEAFYQAVRTGRIEEPLPLDAVESIRSAVREQTPTMFDESVSATIAETSAPESEVTVGQADTVREDEIISPPPDPLGGVDKSKAHDFQVAGVFNRLWKVFTSADKVQSSTAAWIKTYNELSGPMASILTWLRNFIER